MLTLRNNQIDFVNGIYKAWNDGHKNVCGVAPCGFGKTVVMSQIFNDFADRGITMAMAHRQELVSQLSVTLARNGVYHKVVAAEPTIRYCIERNIQETGKNYHHQSASTIAASVQTLNRRFKKMEQTFSQTKMWTIDEAHHVAPDNQWGKCVKLMQNAIGLGLTATPRRPDKKPLGRSIGGLFDFQVNGPTPRELIELGNLCAYRAFAPKQSVDRAMIKISESTGEFQQDSLREVVNGSTITGDAVEKYKELLPEGTRAIAFTVDVAAAEELAAKFNAVGIPAESIDATTPDKQRQNALEKLARGELKVVTNCDLLGEGVDIPACDAAILCRPTESLPLHIQQTGRPLRTAPGKTIAYILDLVGNLIRHGLPDSPIHWDIDCDLRGVRRTMIVDDNPVRTCTKCFLAYEMLVHGRVCPYCGHVEPIADRAQPKLVDGDIIELDEETLARLRGQIPAPDSTPAIRYAADANEIVGKMRQHGEKLAALAVLQRVIDEWGGIQIFGLGATQSQAYRTFNHLFGVDVLTAQTLPRSSMEKLTAKIRSTME